MKTHKEPFWPGREVIYNIEDDWIFEGEEKFPELGNLTQKVQIAELEGFGKCLIMDGITQIGESVDSIYTEALVAPALLSSESRKKCLIIGGGDGAAARELLKQKDVEFVRLVDISETVVKKTQEFIPSFWNGCQNDPRLEIKIADAFAEIEKMGEKGEKFDIIVMDLTDFSNEEYTPFSTSTADHLYTEKSLSSIRKILSSEGVFVAQAQELSPFSYEEHKRMAGLVSKAFPENPAYSYRIFIELFGCWESFIMASPKKGWNPLESMRSIGKNDAILANIGVAADDRQAYLEYLKSMFALPPNLSKKIAD